MLGFLFCYSHDGIKYRANKKQVIESKIMSTNTLMATLNYFYYIYSEAYYITVTMH